MFVAIILLISLILICASYLIWENTTFQVTEYTVKDEKYSGLKIAMVSDLHNHSFGVDNKNLLSELKKISPDYIFFTGDTFDENGYQNAMSLLKNLKNEKVFLIWGNHDLVIPTPQFTAIKEDLKREGIIILENEVHEENFQGKTLSILGLTDLKFYPDASKQDFQDTAKKFSDIENSLVISHRPELFDIYKDNNFRYVFSGHAHGGQWRIFGHGIYTVNQGLFPKYTDGIYHDGATTMIVSRGLGTSVPVPRIFNPPELVLISFE